MADHQATTAETIPGWLLAGLRAFACVSLHAAAASLYHTAPDSPAASAYANALRIQPQPNRSWVPSRSMIST